mmetsp:Transcript_35637/g.39419  ORF Transcript_35637/g.39419 Transcript_35637/m.39419 type:complete len:225 (-) Transcript_35637:122-796(-)
MIFNMSKTTLLLLLTIYCSIDISNGFTIYPITSSRSLSLREGTDNSNTRPNGEGQEIPKSLSDKMNTWGMDLKPRAIKMEEKCSNESQTHKQILYSIQSFVMYNTFILYRSYRGFFVLLPAVFREVYNKLNKAIDSPFADDPSSYQDLNPETGSPRFRTRVVVTLLSSIVTFSYMLNGAIRVMKKFIKTMTKTRSAFSSIEAAADKFEDNENKFIQFSEGKGKN